MYIVHVAKWLNRNWCSSSSGLMDNATQPFDDGNTMPETTGKLEGVIHDDRSSRRLQPTAIKLDLIDDDAPIMYLALHAHISMGFHHCLPACARFIIVSLFYNTSYSTSLAKCQH